jgi:hypothetical protein
VKERALARQLRFERFDSIRRRFRLTRVRHDEAAVYFDSTVAERVMARLLRTTSP